MYITINMQNREKPAFCHKLILNIIQYAHPTYPPLPTPSQNCISRQQRQNHLRKNQKNIRHPRRPPLALQRTRRTKSQNTSTETTQIRINTHRFQSRNCPPLQLSQPLMKSTELSDLILRHTNKLLQSCKPLDANMVINYVEVIKNMCLTLLSDSDHINIVYEKLLLFLRTADNQQTIRNFTQSLCKTTTSVQQKIRAVCLLHEMTEAVRHAYLKQIVPLIPYFKSCQLVILLYQKWRYNYKYTYQLLDQIHNNEVFVKMNDIHQSYFKLLFLDSIRGQFSPSQQSIYAKVMVLFERHTGPLEHTKLTKLIKMLHSESFYVHSDVGRALIQYNLNTFINIAKNQNYDKQNITISQMVEIYLGFDLNYPGQTLLNQITEVARNTKLKITKSNLALYRKLLHNVLRNIQKVIKYERRDTLNKEYTNDTLQFLKQFLPKYIAEWPEVIFQINNAANQLFPPSTPSSLLSTIEQVFAQVIANSTSRISLKDPAFTLKVLRFVVQYRDKGGFVLPQTLYSSLLSQILKSKPTQNRRLQQLQILYLTLTLIEPNNQKQNLRSLISEVNKSVVERQIQKQMSRQTQTGIINSLGHNIIWLSLCTAKILSLGITINETSTQIFINEKLFYMINSLQYLQVYEILVMTLKIDRLRPQVYEKLMYNLSTFIIYIANRNSKSTTEFYLNHKYLSLYQHICRLVLSHKHRFKPVVHKDCFKVLQIMLFKNIAHFKNQDLLDFLDILAEPSFLSISIQKLIEHIRFTSFQLEPYSSSKVLRSFEYYNASLLRYYEGKYDQLQIKKRLRGDTLTKRQIQQYFSKTQVYKTIIMNGDLNIRFEVPQPQTHLSDFKCIYICHRIFQRIKMFNNYDFNEELNYKTHQIAFNQVDLQQQKSYIDREQLIPQISDNQLKIQNRTLPKYIKLQVWKTYVFFDKDCAIDAKDLYLNNQKLTDEILTKVIKGVNGSYEKVREVIKEFTFNEQLLTFVQQSNITHINHGAALEIKQIGVEQPLLTLLWANNTNYKIIYICAHLMAQKGFKVAILRQNQKLQTVTRFLKQNYAAKEDTPKKVKEEGDVQP